MSVLQIKARKRRSLKVERSTLNNSQSCPQSSFWTELGKEGGALRGAPRRSPFLSLRAPLSFFSLGLFKNTRKTSKTPRRIFLRPERPFTEVSGPSRKKSQKKSLPSVQKVSKRVKKRQKKDFSETFLRLFDSLRDFLDTPGPEARGDFLGILGPEGPENGRSGLKNFPHLVNPQILENKQKTLKKTKEIPSKKTPRKQKHQGKDGQGPCHANTFAHKTPHLKEFDGSLPLNSLKINSAKTWCIAKKGLFISCTQGGL